MDFRMAYPGEFLEDEAQIWRRYGDIANQLDAGVFKVRISLVWHQFQLEQDEVTGQQFGAACLVNFLDSLTVGRKKIWQNDTSNSLERNNITQNSVDTLFHLSLNYLLSNVIVKHFETPVVYMH